MPLSSVLRRLETKLPPLLLVLALAALAWLLAWQWPALNLRFAGQRWFALGLAVLAAAIALAGVRAFRQHGTTVDPTRPEHSSAVVSSGIYRFTRNPMYLGFGLGLTAWVIALGNAAAALLIPVYVAYMVRFQIRPEEAALHAKFGEPFLAYMRRVRRWL
ncbi:methyltransferase family protein [Roseateles sp. PN1]|uniref:methyltransferase family protein n=1 Tax=Roseateles sp. PN1 TaxID=3137372 RepID=UPI003138F29C